VSRVIKMPFRQVRDPWWDLDGTGVRRLRRRRVALSLGILLVAVSLLVVVWGVVPVRAASTTVNLDQWASKDVAWQNGNLNGNNSRYPEGGIVPFRIAFEGLKKGAHSIHINYDFTAGGHKAYDFLATWNVTNAKGKQCGGAGGAISSMCPSLPGSSSYAFPSDGYTANGLTVRGAEVYSGTPRRLTIWGGKITSISKVVHSGSPNGNSTADYLVKFTSTGSSVLLAWGGHLAQSAYWDKARGGAPDGAAQVSGAPWHMRTLQLDASGNKNQDRSIQPSAIVGALPPFALAPPTPTPRPTAPPAGVAPTPRTGGPGAPGGPADPPGVVVTVPPTSTLSDVRPGTADSIGALLAAIGVAGLAAALGARRASRSRRRT
jgi:hypothetical protein